MIVLSQSPACNQRLLALTLGRYVEQQPGARQRACDLFNQREGNLSKITVINKIPGSMLGVMEQQFELMQNWMSPILQNWMAPILQSARSQTEEIKQLRESVVRCLQNYQHLIERMRAGGRRDEVK